MGKKTDLDLKKNVDVGIENARAELLGAATTLAAWFGCIATTAESGEQPQRQYIEKGVKLQLSKTKMVVLAKTIENALSKADTKLETKMLLASAQREMERSIHGTSDQLNNETFNAMIGFAQGLLDKNSNAPLAKEEATHIIRGVKKAARAVENWFEGDEAEEIMVPEYNANLVIPDRATAETYLSAWNNIVVRNSWDIEAKLKPYWTVGGTPRVSESRTSNDSVLEELTRENTGLRRSLSEAQASLSDLQTRSSSFTGSSASTENVDRLTRENGELRKELETANNKIKDLESRVAELLQEEVDMEAGMRNTDRVTIERLEKEKKDLDTALQSLRTSSDTKMKEMEKRLNEKDMTINQKTEQLKSKISAIANLEEQVKSGTENASLSILQREELNRKNKEISELQKRVNELNVTTRTMESSLETVKNQLEGRDADVFNKITERDNIIQGLRQRVDQLTEEGQKLLDEHEVLKKVEVELRTQINNMAEDIFLLKQDKKTLEQENKKLENDRNDKSENLEKYKNYHNELIVKMTEADETIKKYETEKSQRTASLAGLEKAQNALSEQLDTLRNNMKQKSEDNDTLRNALEEKAELLKKATMKIEDLGRDLEIKRNQLIELQTKKEVQHPPPEQAAVPVVPPLSFKGVTEVDNVSTVQSARKPKKQHDLFEKKNDDEEEMPANRMVKKGVDVEGAAKRRQGMMIDTRASRRGLVLTDRREKKYLSKEQKDIIRKTMEHLAIEGWMETIGVALDLDKDVSTIIRRLGLVGMGVGGQEEKEIKDLIAKLKLDNEEDKGVVLSTDTTAAPINTTAAGEEDKGVVLSTDTTAAPINTTAAGEEEDDYDEEPPKRII